ncbi:MAG TPA: tetratricopeptide repeat-containing sensor histidine kinase [Mucilaginibacter sp.]|nr:tetratricopeptide repeat-containing sensor histidine kinase [Mucilaginibacter sp.]
MLFNKVSLRLLLAALQLFAGFTVLAQPDSTGLLNKWHRAQLEKNYASDTGNVILLNKLSEQYLYNQTDSALYFGRQALQLAQRQKYIIGEAAANLNISRTYYVKGNYSESLEIGTKLFATSEKINYKPGIAGAYQIIGLIYAVENKYDLAISNLNKALNIFIELKDDSRIGKAYFNIGLCYDEMGQHIQSFSYMDKAIKSGRKAGDYNLVSMAFNRFGEANYHLKRFSRAIGYYQRVIDSKYSSVWETEFALSGLAQCYYSIGDYDKAIINAQKSLQLVKDVSSESDRIRTLMILASSYAAKKDYKQAYFYQTAYKNASDSVFNSKKDKEISNLHLKQQQADNTQLVNQIKIKEQSIAFSRRLFWIRNFIALFAIIFVVIVIRNNRKKAALNTVLQKQNADIASQKAEISQQKETLHKLNHTKDQLFSVISHDLRSPFAAILQTMDDMKTGELSPEEQKEVMNGFYQQLSLVTTMLNNLLVWASDQQKGDNTSIETINVTKVIDNIIDISKFLANNKRIRLIHNFTGEKFVLADLNHVKIIFTNLINNAIKFTAHGGTIEIFYTQDQDYLAVHVKDNGIGILPQKMEKLFKITGKNISAYGTNNEAGAGIGLGLIKQFVDANNGKIEVNSKPGDGAEFIVYLEKVV